MALFSHPEFDAHEQVVFCRDSGSDLRAIIAVHNTHRGPALGGCRMWPYATEDDALEDVLRLSRGMTYKAAVADLPLGGGKAVILGDPHRHKLPELLAAMGRFVDHMGGRYIVAEDSGTTVEDLQAMQLQTRHVSGVAEKPVAGGGQRSGDPSPSTAEGVFRGLQAAVHHRLRRDDLHGLRVAVQGVGSVGLRLARRLHQAGARLWVSDIHPEAVQRAVQEFGAVPVTEDAIFEQEVDVFAPCALGAVINNRTISRLRAAVVAGAANNQLAEARHDALLAERGILYAPDYVVNAGGLVDVALEYLGVHEHDHLERKMQGIHDTLLEIFRRARACDLPTGEVADRIAEERFRPS